MSWKNALLLLFESPATFDVVKETEHAWVITDKFPKAVLHLLVIPKVRLPRGVPDLRPEHVPLLQHMHELAAQHAGCLVGFHKVPSMNQLHLHVISPDLSRCKTKKHRESFRPENMLRVDEVIAALEGGRS